MEYYHLLINRVDPKWNQHFSLIVFPLPFTAPSSINGINLLVVFSFPRQTSGPTQRQNSHPLDSTSFMSSRFPPPCWVCTGLPQPICNFLFLLKQKETTSLCQWCILASSPENSPVVHSACRIISKPLANLTVLHSLFLFALQTHLLSTWNKYSTLS